jgi:hypothetical protein
MSPKTMQLLKTSGLGLFGAIVQVRRRDGGDVLSAARPAGHASSPAGDPNADAERLAAVAIWDLCAASVSQVDEDSRETQRLHR